MILSRPLPLLLAGCALGARAPAFGTTTSTSINGGFTVTMTVDITGWQIDLAGLQSSGAAPITGGSGTWADVPFAFSDFTSGMRVAFTTQPTTRARPGEAIDETSLIGAALSGIVIGASCCEASNTPTLQWCSSEPV